MAHATGFLEDQRGVAHVHVVVCLSPPLHIALHSTTLGFQGLPPAVFFEHIPQRLPGLYGETTVQAPQNIDH